LGGRQARNWHSDYPETSGTTCAHSDRPRERYETDLKQTTNAIFPTTRLSRGSGDDFLLNKHSIER
jgi:hypothetical protein